MLYPMPEEADYRLDLGADVEVKYDEQRPECRECLQLNHICDYNPRLSFQDDTPRTVERMREAFVAGPSVFDGWILPYRELQTKLHAKYAPSILGTNDLRGRERKAEAHAPETYHIIANPNTFAELPEYQNQRSYAHVARHGLFSTASRVNVGEASSPGILTEELNDPNIVILETFEDGLHKGQSQLSHKMEPNLESPTSSHISLSHSTTLSPSNNLAVQSPTDSFSNGELFTHFILLLYEIAAAGRRETNMWQHHSNQLLRIVTLRRQAYGREPFGFIVWTIFRIDIYALLSMAATGVFAQVLKDNVLLASESCLTPPMPGRQGFFHPTTSTNKRFLDCMEEPVPSISNMAQWTWASTTRVFDLVMHVGCPPSSAKYADQFQSCMLYRACKIYADTSMFPGQLNEPLSEFDSDIETCSREIIQGAQIIISQERYELRFIVFPLFMAGFATRDVSEKDIALCLIKTMERHSYGGSTESVRRLLEVIYEKQRSAILRTGLTNEVDWAQEMELTGQQLIIYGL
ncbi:hypothetical protein G7Y89_g4387 [Cudoniella acicularis]|uniref:Zn(2)-C6 fungal-type domain-containing protein n=1 Tax=Cudoniella acicularis TaxID=354080 RepID=A0A8H4RRP6_9HELO|nr:hypothetical protein G7Y89_g4387 [Cudoniella acicularis]